MTGCPKAVQLHRIIPIMMRYNSQKHNPDKKFRMDSRQGTPYPYHEMESNIVSSCEENKLTSQFKAHNFDKFGRTTKKRFKCNPSIGGIHNSERGKHTVCGEHHKIDTSKLSLCAKLNLSDN